MIFVPLLFNPFSTRPVEAVKAAVFESLVVVMLAGLALEGRKRKDFAPRQAGDLSVVARLRLRLWTERPYFLPALAYLAACGLATLLSGDPGGSFRGAASGQGMLFVASLVAFFLAIAESVRSLARGEWLVSGILIGSLPVALYGCIQYFGLDLSPGRLARSSRCTPPPATRFISAPTWPWSSRSAWLASASARPPGR